MDLGKGGAGQECARTSLRSATTSDVNEPYLECGHEFTGRAPHGRHEAALPDEERDGPQGHVDEIQGESRGGVHILLPLLQLLPEQPLQPRRKQPELQSDTR